MNVFPHIHQISYTHERADKRSTHPLRVLADSPYRDGIHNIKVSKLILELATEHKKIGELSPEMRKEFWKRRIVGGILLVPGINILVDTAIRVGQSIQSFFQINLGSPEISSSNESDSIDEEEEESSVRDVTASGNTVIEEPAEEEERAEPEEANVPTQVQQPRPPRRAPRKPTLRLSRNPRVVGGKGGLGNSGNDCYMISTLQALNLVPEMAILLEDAPELLDQEQLEQLLMRTEPIRERYEVASKQFSHLDQSVPAIERSIERLAAYRRKLGQRTATTERSYERSFRVLGEDQKRRFEELIQREDELKARKSELQELIPERLQNRIQNLNQQKLQAFEAAAQLISRLGSLRDTANVQQLQIETQLERATTAAREASEEIERIEAQLLEDEIQQVPQRIEELNGQLRELSQEYSEIFPTAGAIRTASRLFHNLSQMQTRLGATQHHQDILERNIVDLIQQKDRAQAETRESRQAWIPLQDQIRGLIKAKLKWIFEEINKGKTLNREEQELFRKMLLEGGWDELGYGNNGRQLDSESFFTFLTGNVLDKPTFVYHQESIAQNPGEDTRSFEIPEWQGRLSLKPGKESQKFLKHLPTPDNNFASVKGDRARIHLPHLDLEDGTMPLTLPIHMNRIDWHNRQRGGQPQKNETAAIMPEEIYLPIYNGEEPVTQMGHFKLCSVVVHQSSGRDRTARANGGHYVAYTKEEGSDSFIEYNDSRVLHRETDGDKKYINDEISKNGYLYFYRYVDTLPVGEE